MRMLLATFLLAFPTLAFAQETYDLKLPPQGKGDVHRVSVDMEQTIGMQRLDTFGAAFNDRTSSQASRLAYVDEYLDADKDEITRFRRRFEIATESTDAAPPSFLAIHGKTVLVDRRTGTPQVNWEDGKPIGDGVAATLEDALKEGKEKLGAMASFEPLPGRAVKVGESWNIDISAIVKDCEDKHGCKLTGATGVGRLRQVYPAPRDRALRWRSSSASRCGQSRTATWCSNSATTAAQPLMPCTNSPWAAWTDRTNRRCT